MRAAPGAEAVADDIDGRALVMHLGRHQPADGGRAPYLVIAEVERLVAVRQPGLLDALVESGQRISDIAVGAGEVVGLLVAGAADEEGNRTVVAGRHSSGALILGNRGQRRVCPRNACSAGVKGWAPHFGPSSYVSCAVPYVVQHNSRIRSW
ncbi:hypothetical protein D3C78_1379210 [compost metagenome]